MTLLTVRGVTGGYGRIRVLHGIDFDVDSGEIVVILGPNGAGKTTMMRALSGMIQAGGSIVLDGHQLAGLSSERIVKLGVAHVPQGRGTFVEFTVEENLRLGAYVRRDGNVLEDVERSFEWFPQLKSRRSQIAGSLSGGEQQMLAVARALMLRPRLLLLDEPSLGLSPLITKELFGILQAINAELGTTMLIVEQNANLALEFARRAFVLEAGRVISGGDAAELREDESIRRAYLGY